MSDKAKDAIVKVKRYVPERDEQPHWETYFVSWEPLDRVLDALHQIKWKQDGSLTFRRSCAHGICGSDAMLINGDTKLDYKPVTVTNYQPTERKY